VRNHEPACPSHRLDGHGVRDGGSGDARLLAQEVGDLEQREVIGNEVSLMRDHDALDRRRIYRSGINQVPHPLYITRMLEGVDVHAALVHLSTSFWHAPFSFLSSSASALGDPSPHSAGYGQHCEEVGRVANPPGTRGATVDCRHDTRPRPASATPPLLRGLTRLHLGRRLDIYRPFPSWRDQSSERSTGRQASGGAHRTTRFSRAPTAGRLQQLVST
jgi:hypothetical protein